MKTNLYLQYGVIVVLMAISIAYMLRRLAPRIVVRCQRTAASALIKVRHPRAVQALGHWLEPRAAMAGGDCDSGCSSCCGCSSAEPMDDVVDTANSRNTVKESVLHFHARRESGQI